VHRGDGSFDLARIVRESLLVLLAVAALSAALTVVFLSMRSVMRIGGACASGQTPFVIAHPCPKGIPLLMVGGIWSLFIFGGLYAWRASKDGIPSLLLLAWPALFLSLGWNFVYFGIHPPGAGGLAWGWLVCAGVFALMGGLPLVVMVPSIVRAARGQEAPKLDSGRLAVLRAAAARSAGAPLAVPASRSELWRTGAWEANPSPPGEVVSELERLETLHRSGELTDDEYQAAKRTVLGLEEHA
jgi:hypothetical protein